VEGTHHPRYRPRHRKASSSFVPGALYEEVFQRVEKAKADFAAGRYASGASVSTGEWLRHWLAVCIEVEAPSTINRKEWAVHNWLIPMLGDTPLDELTAERIWSQLRVPHDMNGAAGSDKTRIEVLRVLKTALAYAVQWKRIPDNPASSVTFGAPDEVEVDPPTQDEIAALLHAAKKECNTAPWLIGFGLGLRQAEVLGLKWSDVDLETGVLSVKRGRDGRTGMDARSR